MNIINILRSGMNMSISHIHCLYCIFIKTFKVECLYYYKK